MEKEIAPGSGAPVASATGMSDATGFFQAADVRAAAGTDPHLVVERAPGHVAGMEYEIGEGAVLGRGDQAAQFVEHPGVAQLVGVDVEHVEERLGGHQAQLA